MFLGESECIRYTLCRYLLLCGFDILFYGWLWVVRDVVVVVVVMVVCNEMNINIYIYIRWGLNVNFNVCICVCICIRSSLFIFSFYLLFSSLIIYCMCAQHCTALHSIARYQKILEGTY